MDQFSPDMDEIKEFILRRIDLYTTKEDIDFTRDRWESEQEYKSRILEERKSYSLMRIGAAIDTTERSYLGKYFVEEEGDLFEKRFRNADWKVKTQIMDNLFPIDEYGKNWYELSELSQVLDEEISRKLKLQSEAFLFKQKSKYSESEDINQGLQKHIGIHFRYAPFVLRTRKARLFKGWIIGTMERLLSSVKKRFEAVLEEDLKSFGEKIKTEAPGVVKNRSEQINSLMKELSPRKDFEFSHFEFEGGYDENLLLFPPCIQDLMNTMKTKRYLEHHKRFQLGLFLKHTGMSVDNQMQYWFNQAVDNQNISFEEFEKRVGYTIRHLYGLEGKQTDYEMLSCGTIQSSGSYYCRFQDLGLDQIKIIMRDFITSLPGHEQKDKADMFTQELDPKVGQGKPSEACAVNLKLTLGIERIRISHPLQYLEMAARTSDKVTIRGNGEKPSSSSDSDAESEKPNTDISSDAEMEAENPVEGQS